MSTIMDYGYLRAVADGYMRPNRISEEAIYLEKEIADATSRAWNGLLSIIRNTPSFIAEWLEKQRQKRIEELTGTYGGSRYVRGLLS